MSKTNFWIKFRSKRTHLQNFVNIFPLFYKKYFDISVVILKISFRALYKMLQINFDHITFGTR